MSKKEFASNAEIKYASKVLLPKEYCFFDDDEKVEIIKCNESRDIQACPGSGKTTTLLAKLLILANRMPLDGNKGICVLTHTNVAIDEIRTKLGSKADILFRYPNHFGTIQSFVDKYLAIPYYVNRNGHKINSISNELYGIAIGKAFERKIFALKRNQLSKNIWSLVNNFSYDGDKSAFLSRLRLARINDSFEILKGDGKALSFDKPRRKNQKQYQNWDDAEKLRIKKWFSNLIISVHKVQGVLSYQDAFLYGGEYVRKYPDLNDALSSRFQYVFIDEMQDTAQHQLDILEMVFDYEKTIIQRLGDPHQSIYNRVSLEKVWEPRNPLFINSSRRFGESITSILRTVCIEENTELIGSEDISSLTPVMIVFEDPNEVLPKFCELLLNKTTEYEGEVLSVFEISKRERRPVKAVGWVGSELGESNLERFKLKSYFKDYNKEVKKKDKVDYQSLKSFLRKIEGAKAKDYSDKIIESILQVLRLDRVTYEKNGRDFYYTKTSFLNVLNELELKDKFLKKCSKWISQIHRADTYNDEIVEKIIKYFTKKLFPIFKVDKENSDVKNFLHGEINEAIFSEEILKAANFYTYNSNEDLKVEVSNIHRVKGETHTATLYLETSYKAKLPCEGFETERILDQLKGNPYTNSNPKIQKLNKETLKMAYVGMSRPRYLLCMAVHKKRYDEKFNVENGGLWEIVKTF